MGPPTTRLASLGLAALALAVPPVVIEGALRLAGYRLSAVLHAPDGELPWWNLPGQRVRVSGSHARRGEVTVNSMGMRGAETLVPKPQGTRRVLCVGDSYTFGWGVSDDETYPARLEAILRGGSREAAGKPRLRYEVLNAGCYGYTIVQEDALLRAKGPRLEADEIVIGLNRTDIAELKYLPATLAGLRGPARPLDRLLGRTLTGRALLDWRASRPVAPPSRPPPVPSAAETPTRSAHEAYLAALLRAARRARESGARFWLVNFDYGGRDGRDLMRLASGRAREAGILIEDLSSEPFMSDPAYRLPDGHLNARGYDAVARRVGRRLLEAR